MYFTLKDFANVNNYILFSQIILSIFANNIL